jgi:hypothetical protein
MGRLIVRYDLRWNANTNLRGIQLHFEGGGTAEVPVDSPEEFIAVAAILSRSPVFLLPDGTIVYNSDRG